MRNYELVFIVHPEVDDEGLAAIVETVKDLVKRGGGQVTKVDLWGVRRLAYPIKKQREGQYVLMRLDMASEGVAELERSLGLSEQVIRHLVVRLEDDDQVLSAKEPRVEVAELPEEPSAEYMDSES
ncbi:MAG: 30S ribosomal protein S6 [Anaerolineae bacterium]|nr:30S ribosomal protein S6 [Anaerolineae bacterium]